MRGSSGAGAALAARRKASDGARESFIFGIEMDWA